MLSTPAKRKRYKLSWFSMSYTFHCADNVNGSMPTNHVGCGGSIPTSALSRFWVERIDRSEAKSLCLRHPHAPTLPSASGYCYRLTIGDNFAGLAVWGKGVCPKGTEKRLLSLDAQMDQYLELNRFFVVDGSPPNTASKFLSVTHRLLRKTQPNVSYLFTYAAGFQGLVGTIYQASGYIYLGHKKTDAFLYVPGWGLIHRISLWRAYGIGCSHAKWWQTIYPGSKQWNGHNFEYLYDLRSTGRFTSRPYPTKNDLQIWTLDAEGGRENIDPVQAKNVPIVKLPYRGVKPLRIPKSRTNTWRHDLDGLT